MELYGTANLNQFQQVYLAWIEAALNDKTQDRDEIWTERIAVGSLKYVEGS